MSAERPSILLVDDSLVVTRSLRRVLLENGYTVTPAGSGREALDIAASMTPDLFLLDIMMPEMNGYDLCRRLKEDPRLADVPVIFITALDRKDDIVAGFAIGAVDYIPKPFSNEEVIARVGAHIRLHRLRRENAAYAQRMEAIAEERARALVHAERLANVGLLAAGVAHEINNPTSVVCGNVQMLRRIWPAVAEALRGVEDADRQLRMAREDGEELLADTAGAAERIRRIVNDLKQFSRKEHAGGREPCAINECVEVALGLCRNALKYHVTVEADLADDLPDVPAHPQQIEQVLVNLFTNAADALEEKGEGRLLVRTRAVDEGVEIRVEDDGPGVPDGIADEIFDAFYTTKGSNRGSGLGLSISRGIVEDHGGGIAVGNRPEGGARFVIHLPADRRGDAAAPDEKEAHA